MSDAWVLRDVVNMEVVTSHEIIYVLQQCSQDEALMGQVYIYY